jgi:hypothetical protein
MIKKNYKKINEKDIKSVMTPIYSQITIIGSEIYVILISDILYSKKYFFTQYILHTFHYKSLSCSMMNMSRYTPPYTSAQKMVAIH